MPVRLIQVNRVVSVAHQLTTTLARSRASSTVLVTARTCLLHRRSSDPPDNVEIRPVHVARHALEPPAALGQIATVLDQSAATLRCSYIGQTTDLEGQCDFDNAVNDEPHSEDDGQNR